MNLTMLRGPQIRFPGGLFNPGFVTPHPHKVIMLGCGVTTVIYPQNKEMTCGPPTVGQIMRELNQ
jgi:hypothetical protein